MRRHVADVGLGFDTADCRSWPKGFVQYKSQNFQVREELLSKYSEVFRLESSRVMSELQKFHDCLLDILMFAFESLPDFKAGRRDEMKAEIITCFRPCGHHHNLCQLMTSSPE